MPVVESADETMNILHLVVPKRKLFEVLRDCHDGVSGDHFMATKILIKAGDMIYRSI